MTFTFIVNLQCSILFYILFHYRFLQDTELSSLCYIVGLCFFFTFLVLSFVAQIYLILVKTHLSIFPLVTYAFGSYLKDHYLSRGISFHLCFLSILYF